MSITPEAIDDCAAESAHREHLNALRALELVRASKRIHDHYDQLLRCEKPERMGRRMMDRRVMDRTPADAALASRFVQRPVSDMQDMDLHLSADQ